MAGKNRGLGMKYKMALLAATMFVSFGISPASAATLLDLIDAPGQVDTRYALAFTAGSGTTTISFAGYQRFGFESASVIGLFLNNSGSDLTGGTTNGFTFTPAASGSFARNRNNVLEFMGTTPGSYDIFSQNFATAIGSNYTLRFIYLNSFSIPNGFRVDASDATVGAIPEPATWTMMLIGFGAMGVSLRRRRRTNTLFQAA